MISPSEGKVQKEAGRQTRLRGRRVRARSGAPQPSAQEPGRRLRTRRRCRWDAVTDLEHGAALPMPPPPPPAVPGFWRPSQIGHLSYFPLGRSYRPCPRWCSGKGVVLTRFPKGREAPRGLQGFALFLRGAAGAQSLALSLGSSAPCPSGSRHLSSPFTARTAKGLDSHWRDFGNTKGTKEREKYHVKICWPKRSSRACGWWYFRALSLCISVSPQCLVPQQAPPQLSFLLALLQGFFTLVCCCWGFPGGREPACQCRQR